MQFVICVSLCKILRGSRDVVQKTINRNVNKNLKIVNATKTGKSQQEVMMELNITQVTFCRMIKNDTELENQAHKGHCRNKRDQKSGISTSCDIDEEVQA